MLDGSVARDADDVEAKTWRTWVLGPSLSPQALGGSHQLGSFPCVDACEGSFEGAAPAETHLDDGDDVTLLDEKVDLVAPDTQLALEDAVATPKQMRFGYTLTTIARDLARGCHTHPSVALRRSCDLSKP